MYKPKMLPMRAARQLLRPALLIVTTVAVMLVSLIAPSVIRVSAGGGDLLTSDITASRATLASGEQVTLTVTLRNTGATANTADVTVQLPPELAYVPGSVSGDGAVQDKTISWSSVSVPAHGSVPLSLQATTAADVQANKQVMVVAAIMSDQLHMIRFVSLTLVSGIPPASDLTQSVKTASQSVVTPGDQLTYTIKLINGGAASATATVTDPLPAQFDYVAGSASAGGVYDAAARQVTWTDVTVSGGATVALTFDVTGTADHPVTVRNTAKIAVSGGDPLERSVDVLLVPKPQPQANPLAESYKVASKHCIASGEELTYRIKLINSSANSATATVVDPIPGQMNYVAGSVTGGGVYDPAARHVTWTNLSVPERGTLLLTFAVTGSVDAPTAVMNSATITATGNTPFERHAVVLLLPTPPPPPNPLAASYKEASKLIAASGEEVTFTVRLINSSTSDAVATVVDPIPAPLSYVANSATGGGVYDSATKRITWSDVTVSSGGTVSLSFTTSGMADLPTPVKNTATITVGTESISRSVTILLSPVPATSDRIRPVVHSLTIDEQDVLTGPNVTLHINATDNVGAAHMYLREWQLDTTSYLPHWEVVHSSGWQLFASDVPWTLGSATGIHYVGVWVADAAHNTSRLDRNAIDFASLILPDTSLARGRFAAYLVHYDANTAVQATLAPAKGAADMLVWYPFSFWWPDQVGNSVSFTTPRQGAYLFGVFARSDVTYNLTITPGGGPRVGAAPAVPDGASYGTAAEQPNLFDNPLNGSGIDPLGDATAPADAPDQATITCYLPLLLR